MKKLGALGARAAVQRTFDEPAGIDSRAILEARLRILEYALDHGVSEIMRRVLDEAEELTGSCIGFFHFIEPDQKHLTLQAWSTRTVNEFCQAEGEGQHYPIDKAGVWVDCLQKQEPIIYNDYKSLAFKKGMPVGHAKVVRFIQVPIVRGGQAVAIIGVGNKASDYGDDDVEIVSGLADLTWDITSKRIAEESASRSEALNEAILNSLDAIIAVVDREGKVTALNQAWHDFFREHEGEVSICAECLCITQDGCGADLPEFSDARHGLEAIAKAESTGFEVEYPCVLGDQTRWFRMKAYPLNYEDGGIVVAHEDITSKKRVETELIANRNRFSAVFHTNPVSIVLTHLRTNRIIDVNKAWLNLLGYERDEVVGNTTQHLGVWQDELAHRRFTSAVMEKGSVSNFETKAIRKTGEVLDVDLYAESILVDNEPCTLSIGLDITDRKRTEALVDQTQMLLEQKVVERTAELEAAYREQEAFNYSVSHDLRGPLRSMDGFCRILLSDHAYRLDAEGRDCLNRICSAAERMGLLVDDLLQLSRINRAELKIQEVDLSRLFSDSINRLIEMDPKRRVKLTLESRMVVPGDPVLLGSMIDNLASNAWRYTSKRKKAEISFSSRSEAGTTVYSVKDNGAGFDMQYASKLFQPFQRLHSDSEFPGLGVGLATVQRIVTRHGGSIWADAKLDKGATFSFTIGNNGKA